MKTATILLALSLISTSLWARPSEPQKIELNRDSNFVSTLGLSQTESDWNDSIINILVIGQDARGGAYSSKTTYVTENGERVNGLASRSDGNMLISFNKVTGQTTIFTIYRGILVPQPFWQNVELAPTTKAEMYLANYYAYAGRKKYIEFMRSFLTDMIKQFQPKEQEKFLLNDRLKIHGILEAEFSSFKLAFKGLLDYSDLFSKFTLAMRGNALQLMQIAKDRKTIFSSLSINAAAAEKGIESGNVAPVDLGEQTKVTEDGLKALRERHAFIAGGYQRSFNHAKFIGTLMGYLGYAMAEADPDLLNAATLKKGFSVLSKTFSLETFAKNLMMTNKKHVFERTGYINNTSNVTVIQAGERPSSLLIYYRNQKSIFPRDHKMLNKINVEHEIIPKGNNCEACYGKN